MASGDCSLLESLQGMASAGTKNFIIFLCTYSVVTWVLLLLCDLNAWSDDCSIQPFFLEQLYMWKESLWFLVCGIICKQDIRYQACWICWFLYRFSSFSVYTTIAVARHKCSYWQQVKKACPSTVRCSQCNFMISVSAVAVAWNEWLTVTLSHGIISGMTSQKVG